MAAAFEIYARALFELAEEQAQTAVVLTELRVISEAVARDKVVYAAMSEGLLDTQTRVRVVKEMLQSAGVSKLATRFITMLAERGRLSDLSALAVELERLLNKKSGVVVGDLYSAVPLSGDEAISLAGGIGKKVGAKVEFHQVVDADLLGGFIARVAGKTFDCSLRTQLEKIQTRLSQ